VQGPREYVIKTLLHGMTGPLEGKTYAAGVMVPMGTNSDEWIASVASYVRNSFGNTGALVTAADVARVRAATAARTSPWTLNEALASLPRPVPIQPAWKATASHNAAAASGALNFAGWSSGVPQEQGMWFQVELPNTVSLTELEFVSAAAGGGRGAPAGRAGGPPAAQDAAPSVGVTTAAADPPGQPPAAAAGGRAGGAGPVVTGFPRAFKVEVSPDGAAWKTAAEGKGTGALTVVTFPPVQAKFVRMTQTDASANAPAWSIQRLRLYESGR
jgi:hypothetical protein